MASDEPGYHLRHIDKAPVGTIGKVLEEALEAIDADEQDAAVMVLVELSDLVGAVKHYLAANHPTVVLADLEKMADITARAFRSGRRS